MTQKPLSGIVVVDLTRYLAGPYCTLLLGGLGAEVIKIEPPGKGDLHRQFPPFGGPQGAAYQRQTADDMGVTLLHRARNKKSITLDLYHPEGRELFKALCRKADVVVENYSPGVMDEMGVSYAVLKELNPGLILCSISGFGQNGPLREWRAYDPVIQSMSGIASVTGFPDRPPVRCGAAISDTVAPLFAVIGILAALRRREQGGTGEWVDVAMLDTSFFLLPELLEYLNGGQEPRRRGNSHAAGTPLNTYPTRDGFVTIAVATDKNWDCLLAALEREDLKADARFATPLSRREHIGLIDDMVAAWLQDRTTADAVAVLQRHDVPAGPVHTLPKLLTELQACDVTLGVVWDRTVPDPQESTTNEDIAAIVAEHKGLFSGLGGVCVGPDIGAAVAAVDTAITQLGLKGITVEPGFHQPPPYADHPKFYPVYQRCQELSGIVAFTMSALLGPDLSYSNPEAVDRVAADFPNLKIVVSHAFWPWVAQSCEVAFRRPNIYLLPDVYGIGMPGYLQWVEAANSYLQDRLLFGSAFPVLGVKQTLEGYQKLPYKAGVLEKVLYKNAARLLGLSV